MKLNLTFCLVTAALMSTTAFAQHGDTSNAKKITEQGAKGDLILGREIKKQQLKSAPQMLGKQDSLPTKQPATAVNKKKAKKKNCRKN
jgi:hypothetical protein